MLGLEGDVNVYAVPNREGSGNARFLRGAGLSVLTVSELGLAGCADAAVLAEAYQLGRALLTHDADFGTLAITAGQPIFGIIYLRPGYSRADFTIATVRELMLADVEITPPFIPMLWQLA